MDPHELAPPPVPPPHPGLWERRPIWLRLAITVLLAGVAAKLVEGWGQALDCAPTTVGQGQCGFMSFVGWLLGGLSAVAVFLVGFIWTMVQWKRGRAKVL